MASNNKINTDRATAQLQQESDLLVSNGSFIDSSNESSVSSKPFLKRRGFLGLLAGTTAALIAGVETAQARYYSSRQVAGIPESWVRQKGLEVNRYANFIKRLRLKYITPRMVLAPHFKKRGRLQNSLPPRHLWKNIAKTLRVVDRLAYELRSPIKELTSLYRSPRYNRACGGKSRSLHMQNNACDVKFVRASPWRAGRTVRAMRDRGMFKGGVGVYKSFIHVDTRGTNASW